MTTPNKFESAARLQRALDKLEAKREANVNAALAEYAEKRAAILAAADPEARALVLAAETPPQPPTPSILDGHMPPDVMAAVLDPDPLPAIGGVEVDRATGKTRRV